MRYLMSIVGAAALLGAGFASAQTAQRRFERDPGKIRTYGFPPSMPLRLPPWEVQQQLMQLQLWAAVGKCVAAQDRESSVAYVASGPKSVAAYEAAQHLAPAFEACLTGSKIADSGNAHFRRAAIADALGIATQRR